MAVSASLRHLRRITRCLLDTSKACQRTLASDTASPAAELTDTEEPFLEAHYPPARGADIAFSSVKGADIYYQRVGHGNHAVLMLPGALGCSHTDFHVQLDTMNRDLFTLIAMDPRGYGKSAVQERDWPEHFLQRDAIDAGRLMKNLEYKKYSLIGWSDGGVSAMILAARYPQHVRKLVVFGSNVYITPEDLKIYEDMRNIGNLSDRLRKLFVGVYGEEYFKKHWSLWVDGIRTYHATRGGDICKEILKDIKCPTLILHGQKDHMVTQDHADYLKDNIEGARLVNLPNGKHNLHKKHFQKFNSLVESFLVQE